MAVGANDKTFIHAMMKRPGKVRRNFLVAAVTELRLRCLQQPPFNLRRVNGMTGSTANIVFQMLGAHEIAVFFAEFMAIHASAAGVSGRKLGESNDLRNVSSTFDMFLAGAMTSFATLPLGTAFLIQFGFPMRTVVEALCLRLVAGCAYLTAGVQRWIGRPVRYCRFGGFGCFGFLPASTQSSGNHDENSDGCNKGDSR